MKLLTKSHYIHLGLVLIIIISLVAVLLVLKTHQNQELGNQEYEATPIYSMDNDPILYSNHLQQISIPSTSMVQIGNKYLPILDINTQKLAIFNGETGQKYEIANNVFGILYPANQKSVYYFKKTALNAEGAFGSIYYYDIELENSYLVASYVRIDQVAISPNGQFIAYYVPKTQEGNSFKTLSIQDIAQNQKRQYLVDNMALEPLLISNDGQFFYTVSKNTANPQLLIYRLQKGSPSADFSLLSKEQLIVEANNIAAIMINKNADQVSVLTRSINGSVDVDYSAGTTVQSRLFNLLNINDQTDDQTDKAVLTFDALWQKSYLKRGKNIYQGLLKNFGIFYNHQEDLSKEEAAYAQVIERLKAGDQPLNSKGLNLQIRPTANSYQAFLETTDGRLLYLPNLDDPKSEWQIIARDIAMTKDQKSCKLMVTADSSIYYINTKGDFILLNLENKPIKSNTESSQNTTSLKMQTQILAKDVDDFKVINANSQLYLYSTKVHQQQGIDLVEIYILEAGNQPHLAIKNAYRPLRTFY